MVTKKTTKATTKPITKTVVEKAKPTPLDIALGNVVVDKVKKVVSYEDESITYKVTNLKINNEPVLVNGTVIEAFIGANNSKAREELKNGAKAVITKDYHKEDEYKIEVV